MRESTSRGAAIDIKDFERRLRGPSVQRPAASDPLSELARLMHGEEPVASSRRLDRLFGAESLRLQEAQLETPAFDEEAFGAELRGALDEGRAQPHEIRSVETGYEAAHEQYHEQYYEEESDRSSGLGHGEPAPGAWEDDPSAYPDYG